jgi:uncharacterized protein (TIGR03437 family)
VAVCAQTSFDNSGNSLLQGTYFIREVWNGNLSNTGLIGEAASLTGTVVFNNGTYTLTAQVADTTVSGGLPQSFSASGNYAVNASGMFAMDDPLSSGDTIFGGVGASAITGSSTESSAFNFMAAVPVGSSISNTSLKGTYRMVGMDYPAGDVTKVSNYTFLINPDGAGNLNVASLTGHAVNVGDNLFNQSISGATYSLATSGGTMTLPAQSGGTSLISGTKQFFVSADGNVIVSGSLAGYDIQVGINVGGSSVSTNFNGTYFAGGEDYDSTSFSANGYYYLDAFAGSAHAGTTNGAATVVEDQRVNPDDSLPYDSTFLDEFNLNSSGVGTETYYLDYVGAGGTARVVTGQSTAYAIELDLQAHSTTPTGPVTLNPLGVVNGANYLPITNPVSPGEFISLFGSGLGPSSVMEASLPYPASLGGVSVSIDGLPAPVQLASSGQINCIVPYGLNSPYAVVTVTYKNQTSNAVTLYTDSSSPGIFTSSESGIGVGAALHPDGSVVTDSHPAQVGEIIAVYVTGLGAVNPTSPDGAPASGTNLSHTTDTIDVYIDGTQATVGYSGLAPGFAGLYQVNFTVPQITDTGEVNLDLFDENNGAYNSIASLPVGSGTTSSVTAKVAHSKVARRRARRPAKTR